jgi:hypothetical protein
VPNNAPNQSFEINGILLAANFFLRMAAKINNDVG